MSQDSRARRPAPLATLVRTLLIATIAGAATAVSDALMAWISGRPGVGVATAYAVALDMLAGLAAGALVGVLVVVGLLVGARSGRSWRIAAVPALAAAPLFCLANRELFTGMWISSQSWVGWAKLGFFTIGPVSVVLAVVLVTRLLRGGAAARWLLGLVALAAAAGCAGANLRAFNAYPSLKHQFAALTWLGLGLVLACASSRRRVRIGREILVVSILAVVAAGGGGLLRRSDSLNRMRATIAGAPFAATRWVMIEVEDTILGRIVGDAGLPEDGGWVDVAPAADATAVQRKLDDLAPERRAFNILWIAVDALRADHVSAHGYERPTTPNLDGLISRSSWFTRAIAPTPSSALAYSSTLTGTYGRASPAYKAQHGTDTEMPDDLSLPSRLKAAGRQTIGLTAFYLATYKLPVFACQRAGFDRFNPRRSNPTVPGAEITTRTLELLDEAQATERPFFLWTHYMDAHAPYNFHDEHPFGTLAIDAYDSEIAYADAQIGRLLEALERRDLADDTIVVVFGDHGEAFGEHNCRRHGAALYQHQVHVPLIVHMPGLAPRRIDKWVGLSDLVSTMMSLLGVKDPYDRLGRDLAPLMLGDEKDWVDTAYSERPAAPRYDPPSWDRAVWSGDLKLIWKPHHRTVEVFDLARDPGELENIYDPGRADHKQLLALMRGWDRRIDSFWGDAAGATGRRPAAVPLPERFGKMTDAVIRAEDAREKAKALKKIVELIESPAIDSEPSRKALLGDDLGRLAGHLAEAVASLPDRSGARSTALEVLAFAGDESHLPLMIRESVRGHVSPRLLMDMTLFRARHGDRTIVPPLKKALAARTAPYPLSVALALALAGDDGGRALLVAALDGTKPVIRTAIEGLSALGDPEPLYRVLFCLDRTWRDTAVLDTLIDAALADETSLGTAALIHLANTASTDTAARAEDELGRRLSAEQRERAGTIYEIAFGAREGIVYKKFDVAAQCLSGARDADDPLMGPWWWLAARSHWALGHTGEARRFLDRLEAATPRRDELAEVVARTREFIEQPPAVSYGSLELGAEVVSNPAIPSPRRSRFFFVDVMLENRTDRYLPGGHFRDNPRLGWYFEDEGGKVRTPQVAVVLPMRGLRPGEKMLVTVIGRLPPKRGRWTPKLGVLTRTKTAARTMILELPAIEL